MNRDNSTAWLIIYSGLTSIQNHPKNRDLTTQDEVPAAKLAAITDKYLAEYNRRFNPDVQED